MDLARFCAASRVVIVAGKGGVGKTAVTAALGAAAARADMSVLVLEVEGKSGLARAFDAPALTYDEQELRPNLRGRLLTADRAMTDYLDSHGLKRIARRMAASGVVDVVATAVPGMRDILILGKVKQLEEARTADLLIIDAPAAGHAVSFLLSPSGLLDAVRGGPIRKQAEDVVAMLTDHGRCRVILVTRPEETPVNELVETAYALEDRAGVSLGPVIVNACTAPVPGFEAGYDPATVADDAARHGMAVSVATSRALAAAVAGSRDEAQRHDAQCRRLEQQLPLPQIRLPRLPASALGSREIDVLADALVCGVEQLDESP